MLNTVQSDSLGIHNGHTVVGGEYKMVMLKEDRYDREVLRTKKEESVRVEGYVPHELVS